MEGETETVRGAMNGAICLSVFIPAHLSRQLSLNIMRDSRACHNIGNMSSSLPSLWWSAVRVHTLIILWTLVYWAINRIVHHSWAIPQQIESLNSQLNLILSSNIMRPDTTERDIRRNERRHPLTKGWRTTTRIYPLGAETIYWHKENKV